MAWLLIVTLMLLLSVLYFLASLYESLICNEYLNDLDGPSLLPGDAALRARARLIIDQVGGRRVGGCRQALLHRTEYLCRCVARPCTPAE
jgi:glutathione S-transferase